MTQQKVARVPATRKPKLVVDEIHVQVLVRELDAKGETVAKHAGAPLRFVNERTFREWAAEPFTFDEQSRPEGAIT